MKKFIAFTSILILMFFMVSCDYFILPVVTTTSERTTVLPTKINGTITFEDSEYQELAVYHSDTYDLSDVDAYNDILLETKNYIRHANIQVNMVLYSQSLPWSTETDRNVVSSGSGVVFLADEDYYYALTNYHVIDQEELTLVLEVKAFGDTEFVSGEIVTFDENLDLAVIKFAIGERTDITIIDIYERLYYQFNPGEIVLAVGNPSSVSNNVTFGEIKNMESLNDVSYKVIYHDASISNGSSGGALVDIDGNLLGINTWGFEDSDEYSFAIPNYIVYTFLINNGILD
ncbi:MAG: trypsin-like peptidase domain-containing protein [Candidatus Izemoplasmatales bacterium]|nr:trypsin-like peptidase domain-containing protein [Candidatus Izemoplasmatales bacterium]